MEGKRFNVTVVGKILFSTLVLDGNGESAILSTQKSTD